MTDFDHRTTEPDSLYRPISGFSAWSTLDPRKQRRQQLVNELDSLRSSAGNKEFEIAFEIVRRAAAVETGAIEGLYETTYGFTMSVARQTAFWQKEAEGRGPNVERTIGDQIAAYEHVLDLSTRSTPITEAAIRELHRIACASQDTYLVTLLDGSQQRQTLPKGEYKSHPNHVMLTDGRVHAYAPVIETPIEMARLVSELTSVDFEAADPVLQAAYAHYAFVSIHPFSDGNGRVARVLSSLYLLRDHSVPLLVLAHQKPSYLVALSAADRDDRDVFVEFISRAVEEGLKLATDVLRLSIEKRRDSVEERILSAYKLRGTLSDTDVDQAGINLLEALRSALETEINTKVGAPWVAMRVEHAHVEQQVSSGKLRLPKRSRGNSLRLIVVATPPLSYSGEALFSVEVPRRSSPDEVVVLRGMSLGTDFEVSLGDILGDIPSIIQIRLSIYAELCIHRLLKHLAEHLDVLARKSIPPTS